MVRRVSATEIEGMKLLGTFCYNPQKVFPVYFVLRVSKTPSASGYWKKQRLMKGVEAEWTPDNGKYKLYTEYGRELAGDDVGYWFTFDDLRAGETVEVRMGISYVSTENARRNLDAEQPAGTSFDAIRGAARTRWNDDLSRIRVEGGTEAQQMVFYTALYHALIHPNLLSDVNGEYPLMERSGEAGVTDGERYTVFSLWDTYRNVHQLLTLVYPERQLDMVRSMIGMYEEWGWMPKWEDGVLDRKFLKKGTVSKFPDQPDLTDSMRAALSVLSKNPEGFFLMLEAGLVDKYSHPLDWERAVYDTIMFDKVVAMAQEFCDKNPDTLLIVTGDHTHSISVIGTVDDNLPGELMRDKVGIYAEAGYPAYKDENGDGYPDDVNVSKRLAVFIGNYPDHYETYRPKMDGPFVPSVKDEKGHYIANAAYKDVPGAQLRIGNLPRTESTGVHSIDDLVVGARGPHADAFRGFMNSTEVFRIMSEALALGNK